MALTALAVGLVVIGRSVQAVDAEGRTRSILARLTAAARTYATDLAPPDWSSADAALRAMRAHPPAAEALAGIPIRVEPGRGLIAIDGYGRPLRFVPPDPPAAPAPGQFVSAGRDGVFGDEPRLDLSPEQRNRAEADNHYGAELVPLGPVYPDTPKQAITDDPSIAPLPPLEP